MNSEINCIKKKEVKTHILILHLLKLNRNEIQLLLQSYNRPCPETQRKKHTIILKRAFQKSVFNILIIILGLPVFY